MKKKCLIKKILLIMRLTFLLLFGFLINTSASVYSQRFTFDSKGATIKEVLSAIESNSSYKFLYRTDLVDVSRAVQHDVRDEDVSVILSKIFDLNEITFRIFEDNLVVITNTNNLQQIKLTGKISDHLTGEPLVGVYVVVEGTNVGVISDESGKFSIEIPSEDAILVVSYVGYNTEKISYTGQSGLDIKLVADIQSLEEIVVIGYGTQKKSDLTGSVASVKSDQLIAYPASGAVQALQGRAAGIQVQSNNGDPGGLLKVRIRGGTSINASSDPIFVVDGLVGAIIPPPEDIASVEVLKDASATAIYGSRGANGVIMVTTKRGKQGKTKIDFNTSFTTQQEINRLDLLNASQFLDYTKEVLPAYVSGGADTDWQDQVFRTGGIKNYQLSFSGGNEAVNYYVSGSYFDQKGVVQGSSFNRFSITSNIDFKATEKLRFGLNIFAQRSGREGARTQEGSAGANEAGVISSAFRFMPDLPIYKADGSYTVASIGDPIDNPYAIARERKEETLTDRAQGNFYLDYKIFKDLSFRSTFGAVTDNGRTGQFIPTTLNQGKNVGGEGRINSDKNTNLINENYLTYSKNTGNHNIVFMTGYSFQKSNFSSWESVGQSFITNSVSYWDLDGASVVQSPNSSWSETQLSSFYARLNYTLRERYLFTFNARYDGSSNFSKNHKWAFFPSGAFAWNMKKEPFMENIPVINALKWRVSYGLTGNQAISSYQTLAQFSTVLTVLNGTTVNAVRPTSVANDNLTWETAAQFDIGADIGILDNRIGLTFDYYNTITSDLLFSVPLPQYSGYSNQLKNIGKVQNKGVEFTLSSRNLVGKFKWNMDINYSANRNKVLELPGGNDIMYGSGPGHMIGLGNTQILREGQAVGSFYGWIYEGVYQEGDTFIPGAGFEIVAGGEKYRDIDGLKDENGKLTGEPDNVLNADDRTIIGNPQPKFFYGWNNSFSWKNLDLDMFIQGSYGNDILSFTLLELETMSGRGNSTTKALERWTPTNTETDVPIRSLSRPQRVSSRWISDGSYVRLKNLSLGYSLPRTVLDKIGIQKFRIYVSAQNILTLTNYRGYDPEVNYRSEDGADANRNLGLDYGSYPNAKSYTLGLNLGF
jgi:TonB-linked SusC/RagA family outer membrane protein